jgi:glycerol kinase
MRHVLAIDEGTTGSTSLVVSQEGRIVGRGYREITQHFPRPGWVEHDANEIFEKTIAAAGEAIRTSGVKPEAIGITNQRETVVVWDRNTGEPVSRAIVWQDRRTAGRCRELAPRAERITALTGLPVDPYFSATKLEHLLATPQLRKRADDGELAAGTIDSWLIWRLTGATAHVTDPTNASRTLLFDIGARNWSDELCAIFGIPRTMLPSVRTSSGQFGVALSEHFGVELPIMGVAGDQQAALFGQGCWRAGEAKNTYGTGAFLLLNTGDARPAPGDGLLATVACEATGGYAYALEGSIFIAGAAVQWLRDGLGIIKVAAETEALARSLDSNDGVYFVPALAGLGAPHWQPEARGTITGLTRGSTRAHFARAALEAMAYGTADVFDAMRDHSGVPSIGSAESVKSAESPLTRLRVDGGAAVNNWLMQFQSDILGVDVERAEMVETTAFGAAGLAGIASGVWEDAQEFLAVRKYSSFSPAMSRSDAANARAGWHRAVNTALYWANNPASA